MGFWAIVKLLVPIILGLFGLFKKTPEDQAEAVRKSVLQYVSDLQAAIKKAEDTDGDTSDLENLINRPKP